MRRSALILSLTVVACGHDATGPSLSEGAASRTSIALGSRFSCALSDAAKPYCWGDGNSGQIGDSTLIRKLAPTPAAGARTFVTISAGDQTACGLDAGGGAWCWGNDPIQPRLVATAPVSVVAPRPFAAISVGRQFVCALATGGDAYCWGENFRGQLGVGDTVDRRAPTPVLGGLKFTAIAAGFWHVCALTPDGAVYCWGDNTYGNLGTGDLASSMTPKRLVGTTAAFKSVSVGSLHSCGITTAGTALCWGSNFAGQLGDGSAQGHVEPKPAAAGHVFTQIRASRANSIFSHTCGLEVGGAVYCWGWNSQGQLGSGPTSEDCLSNIDGSVREQTCSYTAARVPGIPEVTALDVGQEHTCVLTKTNQAFCWGANSFGEVGDGSALTRKTPVMVSGGLRFP